MPVIPNLDPIINYEGEQGTTISGDPYFDNSPVIPYIAPTPTYGGNILVEPLEPLEPIDSIDPAVPIQNNPSNPINILIEPIRENVVSVNESPITVENPSVATTTNQPSTATTTISSVPPKPNTAIMGGGGGKTGTTSVGSDVKKTDKKYWWWIAVAIVGVGLYSYKKSK